MTLPEATVQRLPIYLQCLEELSKDRVSSEELGAKAGLNPAQVRRDLHYLGSKGTRGVGYDATVLSQQLREALGLDQGWGVVIIGVGNLGTALANYGGFDERGFRVAGAFDADPDKVGRRVNGLTVEHVDGLAEAIVERDVHMAIITTPAGAAQGLVEMLAEAGVRSILSFAPAVVRVPPGVRYRRVDLSTELQVLSFYLSNGVG